MTKQKYRVVLDTNVIFEGLSKRDSACGLIIDAWFHDLITVCVSSALAYEYNDVLFRKFGSQKWDYAQPLLRFLLKSAVNISIFYTWRPRSPDPGDDLVIDCVMNANAMLVTANVKDFQKAHKELGLQVFTPVEFLKLL